MGAVFDRRWGAWNGALVFLLAPPLTLWLAARVVGLAGALVGYLLLHKGMSALKRLDPAPRQTIATVQEAAAWAKRQAASGQPDQSGSPAQNSH